MTKDQAIKFKEWITDYVDIDVHVIDGRYLELHLGVCCEVDVHLAYRGRRYIVEEFIYSGGCRASVPMSCRAIAKYARLRLDNGVKRVLTKRLPHLKLSEAQNDKWIMIQHESDKEALSYLDEIIQREEKPKQVWLRVIYRNARLYIVNSNNVDIGLAYKRGDRFTDATCPDRSYEILGYDDEDQNKESLKCEPVGFGEFYNYCLLEEIK